MTKSATLTGKDLIKQGKKLVQKGYDEQYKDAVYSLEHTKGKTPDEVLYHMIMAFAHATNIHDMIVDVIDSHVHNLENVRLALCHVIKCASERLSDSYYDYDNIYTDDPKRHAKYYLTEIEKSTQFLSKLHQFSEFDKFYNPYKDYQFYESTSLKTVGLTHKLTMSDVKYLTNVIENKLAKNKSTYFEK